MWGLIWNKFGEDSTDIVKCVAKKDQIGHKGYGWQWTDDEIYPASEGSRLGFSVHDH